MPRPTISSESARLIVERGPMLSDALAAEMVRLGRTHARNPEAVVRAALDADPRFVELDDGSWTHLHTVFDRATFRHRLTPEEVARETVVLDPDMSPLARIALRPVELSDGGGVLRSSGFRPRRQDPRELTGPRGWLGDASAGDLLEITLSGGRAGVRIGAAPAKPGSDTYVARRLARFVRDWLEDGQGWTPEPVTIEDVVIDAALYWPELAARGFPPLGDVLRRAGFSTHGHLVCTAGYDWEAWEAAEELFWAWDPEDDDALAVWEDAFEEEDGTPH